MPEELPITDPAEIARRNEETLRKQQEQDISGQSAGGPDNLDGGSALDALRNKLVEEKKDEGAEAEAAAKEAAAKEAAAAAAAPPVVDDAAASAAAEAAAKKKAEDDAVAARADEIFKDAPGLAPNASERSGAAFKAVKIQAARDISRLEAEKAEVARKLQEAEDKLKNPIPPEVDQELKALREFRAKLDLEADPKFKVFDKDIQAANDFIYAQLKKSPVITDEIIADIKKYGGPENVNMEKILEAVKDPLIRRLVESKQAELAMIAHNKAKVIEENKSNIAKYVEDRDKEWQNAASAHNTRTKENLENFASKLEWLNPKQLDPKADEATRKAVEAHNAYAANMRKELDLAISDDSPEMRATLLIGMVNLFRLQSSHEALKAAHEKATKDLAAANEQLTKFKSASVSRLRDSGAPPAGSVQAAKPAVNFNESAAEAIDRMRKERLAREAA